MPTLRAKERRRAVHGEEKAVRRRAWSLAANHPRSKGGVRGARKSTICQPDREEFANREKPAADAGLATTREHPASAGDQVEFANREKPAADAGLATKVSAKMMILTRVVRRPGEKQRRMLAQR